MKRDDLLHVVPAGMRQLSGSAMLAEEIHAFDPAPPAIRNLPDRREVMRMVLDYRQQRQRERRLAEQGEREAPEAMAQGMAGEGDSEMEMAGREQRRRNDDGGRQAVRQTYVQSIAARFETAITSPTPFAERLVHFWSNHFAVSADNIQIVGLAGPFEFEAIRPHVYGNFTDMLLAVERHPAMLLYLDQAQSIGPNSRFGQRRNQRNNQRGLNENLAREILELHTLGVRSGYTQEDVLELAKALTGHGIIGGQGRPRRMEEAGEPGDYIFRWQAHEPGERQVLGRRYREGGAQQAGSILRDLAMTEATACHLSTKLVRHFVADEPPAALVERMAQAYLAHAGSLPHVYEVMLGSAEIRDPANTKFLDPWSWTVAVARTAGIDRVRNGRQVFGLLNQLGQAIWRPGSPAGFGDDRATWLGPDTLLRRIEATPRILAGAQSMPDARSRAVEVLGDRLSSETRQAIARAEDARQAMALLVLSPEFLYQ